MAYKRLERLTGCEEQPGETWAYVCDAEADVTTALPGECVMVLVAEPGSGKSPVRLRTTAGQWKELG